MLYEVKLADSELAALAALIGQPLDLLGCDLSAAELHSAKNVLVVTPLEVATPDKHHPYADVERPLVRGNGPSVVGGGLRLLEENLGIVREVNIISILLGFSPPVHCPPEEILPGVVLPASQGYGWVYYPPAQRGLAEREVGDDASLVDLDVAFELVTDRFPNLVLYTCGFWVNVSPGGLPADEEWVKFGAFIRRPLATFRDK